MDLCEFKVENYGQPRHFWEQAKLCAITRLLDDGGRWQQVLEIGCGDGAVLFALAKRYPRCRFWGVDNAFTPELLDFFTRQPDYPPNLELSAEIPGGTVFDALLLFDVLEHIDDDQAFLAQMLPLLRPGATVAVTVPAFQSLFSEHDRFLRHFRRYRKSQLTKLLQKAGLQTVNSGYLFSSLLPLRTLQKWTEKFRKKTGKVQLQKIGTLNPVWAMLLKLDVRFGLFVHQFNLNLPGLSCFAICKKP